MVSAEENVRAVRALLEDRARAIAASDARRVVAANASDIVTFDVLPPLVSAGNDSVTQRTGKWLESYSQAPAYEIRDLRISGGEDVAFAFYLYRVSGRLKNGQEVNMWVRCTVGLEKSDGGWQIIHQHDSVPFDPETGRAVLTAEP